MQLRPSQFSQIHTPLVAGRRATATFGPPSQIFRQRVAVNTTPQHGCVVLTFPPRTRRRMCFLPVSAIHRSGGYYRNRRLDVEPSNGHFDGFSSFFCTTQCFTNSSFAVAGPRIIDETLTLSPSAIFFADLGSICEIEPPWKTNPAPLP